MSLENIAKPLLEFFKHPQYAIGLGVAAAVGLFTPDSIVTKVGLLHYRDEGKPYFGAILLVCIAVTFASGIGATRQQINRHGLRQARKKRLHRLTIEEKQILGAYIERQTRSLNLDVTSGIVNGLEQDGIIYQASILGHLRSGFAYNIQPWAWDYLNQHLDLLR